MILGNSKQSNYPFFCPVCENHVELFHPFGLKQRKNALCPICGSLERHRFVWVFFEKFTNLFNLPSKRFLHIAPEACLSKRLSNAAGVNYISSSFSPGKAMITMDIRKTGFPNESFDVIYCSHVLEHIEEDFIAILELNRILDRKGWAIFQVPILNQPTYEDFSIKSPKQRELAFGQKDHVRKYGIDFKDRLSNGGFCVGHFKPVDILTHEEAVKIGIKRDLYAGGDRKSVV